MTSYPNKLKMYITNSFYQLLQVRTSRRVVVNEYDIIVSAW